MFGIGIPELIIIMVIALIVIGPKKLPELARALGKGMSEFKNAAQDIKESLDLNEEISQAKEDLVDSVSGLGDLQDLTSPRPPEKEKSNHKDIVEIPKESGDTKSLSQKDDEGLSDTDAVKGEKEGG